MFVSRDSKIFPLIYIDHRCFSQDGLMQAPESSCGQEPYYSISDTKQDLSFF